LSHLQEWNVAHLWLVNC